MSTPGGTSRLLRASLPTPTYGAKGIFSIHCTTHIKAAPFTALIALLTPTTYPSWNAFCPYIAIDSQPDKPTSQAPSTPPTSNTSGDDGRALALVTELEAAPAATMKLGTVFTETVYMDGSGLVSASKARPAREIGARAQQCRITVIDEYRRSPTEPQNITAAVDAAGPGFPEVVVGNEARRTLRVAWVAVGTPTWLLRSERVQLFTDDGHGGCEYECWETFGGPVAWLVWLFVGRLLVERFWDWAVGLKGFAEGEGGRGDVGGGGEVRVI